jgi:hypothetical protein
MDAHRSAGPPAGVARPGSPEFEHQRRLLLELAGRPAAMRPDRSRLAAVLELTAPQIQAAAAGLERAGLVDCRADRLLVAPPVLAVEMLWPFAL